MYCPNCQQEYEGKFCPECGTKLVEKPAQATGVNLNLGDANAISGGVHLSDSHNVHNEDRSIHNITNTTSTVNNITQVAAQKTETEILQERKKRFMEVVNKVFEDGILEQDEEIQLEQERIRIGLDELTAKHLIETAKKIIPSGTRQTFLSGPAAIILNQISRFLLDNNVEMIRKQIPRLRSFARNTAVDDVQYLYYLTLAALNPESLISEYEETITDNYWCSYWTYVAYLKQGQVDKADDIIFELARFTTYPEENITLLSTLGALKEYGTDAARELLGTVTGIYSKTLEGYANSLFLSLEPELASAMSIKDGDCLFYLNNIVSSFVAPSIPLVDLGLPSGTLWAACNLGADTPEEFGSYYAWGEVESKEVFSWETYKWCKGKDHSLIKYNYESECGPIIDNKDRLDEQDDVARSVLGNNFRIPTVNDVWELIENCNWSWIQLKGVYGVKGQSSIEGYKDRWIFFPSAGTKGEETLSKDKGFYWTCEALYGTDSASIFVIGEPDWHGDVIDTTYCERGEGLSIRPVFK